MELSLDDTIAALASAPGGARRGIVRISGPQVRHLLSTCFEPDEVNAWEAVRQASVHSGVLKDMSSRTPIRVDVYFWPNRRSYTGQPLAEMHLAGAPPLLEAALSAVYRSGVRPARPGEFTLRAFLAGKLDLIQAEAVLGVIDANDHAELQAALAQLAGGLSGQLSRLRHDILELLADLEAGLDFIEEDITFIGRCELLGRIALARNLVNVLLQQSSRRMQSNSRPRVVLAGLPNAGKSTLFNRLANANTALVSPQEGTTRDFLAAPVTWKGLTFDLIDTAGWEASAVRIAEAAQQKRSEQLNDADVLVWCSPANLVETQHRLDDELFGDASRRARGFIRILTQTDRPDARNWLMEPNEELPAFGSRPMEIPETSAINGLGLDELALAIQSRLTSSRGVARQWLGMTAARCRESLEAVLSALDRAEFAAADEAIGDELIAVDIRDALDHLGRILGTVYTDDILDRVFSKFCIGK